MEKSKTDLSKFGLPLKLFIVIMAATFCLFFILWLLADKYPMLIYFLGVMILLIALGLFFLSFLHLGIVKELMVHNNRMDEKELENSFKVEAQNQLTLDVEYRRAFERERCQTNDLFRLIELARKIHTETTDKTRTEVHGTELKTEIKDIPSTKDELVDPVLLATLINAYQSLLSTQQTKTT